MNIKYIKKIYLILLLFYINRYFINILFLKKSDFFSKIISEYVSGKEFDALVDGVKISILPSIRLFYLFVI